VCTHAAASSAFQGPDGFSGGEQSSFLSAFWRFLRPHTIRGTILGTSAVVTKVGNRGGRVGGERGGDDCAVSTACMGIPSSQKLFSPCCWRAGGLACHTYSEPRVCPASFLPLVAQGADKLKVTACRGGGLRVAMAAQGC
jgi:hypothetical protein